MATRARPLSPHLQVYRPQLTTTMSILHRATGIGLCAAALVLVCGLLSLAAGPDSWAQFAHLMNGTIGKLVTAAFLLTLVYHWLNGLRHLVWDTGWGLDLKRAYATGWTVAILTPLLTALILWRLWA